MFNSFERRFISLSFSVFFLFLKNLLLCFDANFVIFVLTFVLRTLSFVDSSCTTNYSLITAICCATSCVQLISKELKIERDETRENTIHNILEAC